MPVLEWRETARGDLLAIVDYISDDNPDAAQRRKDDIEAKARSLPEHPKLYRAGRVTGTREMVVRSNYVVIHTEDIRAVTIICAARGAAMAASTGMRRWRRGMVSHLSLPAQSQASPKRRRGSSRWKAR